MNVYLLLYNDGNNVWKRHFHSELISMGHKVIVPQGLGLDVGWKYLQEGKSTRAIREQSTQKLLADVTKLHKEGGIHLLIAMVRPFQFHPQVFREIEHLGIPTALYECDNLNSDRVRVKLSPYFTTTGYAEEAAGALFQRSKVNSVHLPMAAAPSTFFPIPRPEVREISFVGSKNPYRRLLLGQAIERGLPIEIYGGLWHPESDYYRLEKPVTPKASEESKQKLEERISQWLSFKVSACKDLIKFGPSMPWRRRRNAMLGLEFDETVTRASQPASTSFERVRELYAESKVSLGINHYVPPSQDYSPTYTYARNRDFEAPMSGACYLTEYASELDNYYPEPDLIWTFRSLEELVEKANFLRSDVTTREKLRRRAYEYALKHHRWTHRFEKLFKHLGLQPI